MLSYLLWNVWFIGTIFCMFIGLWSNGFLKKETWESGQNLDVKKLLQIFIAAILWPITLAIYIWEKITPDSDRED